MSTLLIAALAAATTAFGPKPGPKPTGPYKTTYKSFTNSGMDKTNDHIDVVYPVAPAGTVFPLIAYAHGFGDEAYSVYHDLFDEMASWGYVIGAALACKDGCISDCKDGRLDPPCFGHYYKQQLKVIDWANAQAALPINKTCGVGVAGHSMGGQSTLYSAAYNSSTHNIKAAAMHHAFTHTYPAIADVPFITFTGTADDVAPPFMANGIFNAKGAFGTRGLVNKKGANHHEPTTDYNPKIATYTIAWFKVYLDQTPQAHGTDFAGQLYGNGTASLCGGGDGAMADCKMMRNSTN